jgi:hypothetical protein
MTTIWKFKVHQPDTAIFDILMPKGSKILTYQFQQPSWVLWALVDPDGAKETRKFIHCGTGWNVPRLGDGLRNGSYIGTSQVDGLVWHLFEVTS